MTPLPKPEQRSSGARRMALTLAIAATLGGCASTSIDRAIAPLQDTLKDKAQVTVERWPDAQAPSDSAQARIAALRGAPLSQEGAVELALLQHRGLQASLAELGVTQADVAVASQWPTLGFTFQRKRTGEEIEWERSLHLNLGRLLVLPLVRGLEQRRLAQQQALTTLQVVGHVANVRQAWVRTVAAQEKLHYLRQVHEAAEAGAELARRMAKAGNFNALAVAREEGFESDAALDVARAERALDSARERLNRALGLWGEQIQPTLPERLPDLPPPPLDLDGLEARAVAERLDVQAARAATEQTARNLGLTRTTRFVNVLELGALRSNTNEGQHGRAWEVGLELPLFDFGTARVARAEATYLASLHRTAEIAVNARSELREAYRNWRHAWDIAHHLQTEVVPRRLRISEENLKRYNGMLIGVFELLADARAQIGSVNAAIDARRDYWLADADLQMALLGRPTLNAPTPGSAAPATDGGDGH